MPVERFESVFIERTPNGNYFIVDGPKRFSRNLGFAMTLWGARRVARRLVKKGKKTKHSDYRIIEEIRGE